MSQTEHVISYRSEDGRTVRVIVPWPRGVGIIPAPEIVFMVAERDAIVGEGYPLTFVYAGAS